MKINKQTQKQVDSLQADITNLKIFVTPEDFGANVTISDTEALKLCLLQDKPIILTRHYNITEDLYITKRNTKISGKCGNYSATSPTLNMNGFSIICNQEMSGLRMEHIAIRSTTTCLRLYGSGRMDNFYFTDVFFIGNKDVDIDCETGYMYFTECQFKTFIGTSTTNDCLIKLVYTGEGTNRINYIYFNTCAFEGSSIPNSDTSGVLVKMDNCSNINFNNCDICNCRTFIEISTTHGNPSWLKIENNYIWNIRLICNLGGVINYLINGNAIYNKSDQPFLMPNVFRNGIVSNNNFTYWTNPSTGAVCGNIFKGNSIANKSSSLERFAPRDDLINCERTIICTVPATNTHTINIDMKFNYVNDLYLIIDNQNLTYTSSITNNIFTAIITNPTGTEITSIVRVI